MHAVSGVSLVGDSKLPTGVNVGNNCLSLFVSPVTNWQPVHGVAHLLPHRSRDWLQHDHELVK